jgi:hypothetical protein
LAIFDPRRKLGASVTDLEAHELVALDLMQRPTILVPIPTLSASRVLVAGEGILAGFALRDTNGATGSIVYLSSSSANAAAANNNTLPGAAGATTYVTGFEITGDGATAGAIITVTLTGILGGTATYYITIPAGATTAITPLAVEFSSPGFPASGANTAITLNVPSFGAGNTNAAVTIRGYQQSGSNAIAQGVPGITTTIDLLDGLDANGEELFPLSFSSASLIAQGMGREGPLFTRGLFASVAFGSVKGAVYVKI